MTLAAVTLLLSLAIALPAGATPKGWTDNMEAVMAQARAEKKDLLVNFSGSDWCGWCIRLANEVFSKKEFTDEAPKTFVLVELDFPRDKSKVTPQTQRQNQKWQQKLGVRGFPSIFLLDAAGRPYAKTGYRRGGPKPYIAHLAALAKIRAARDAAFATAAKADGVAKARALDKGLGTMDTALAMKAYQDVVKQVLALDAGGKAGLKKKYELQYDINKVTELAAKRDIPGALKAVDALIAKHKPAGQQAQELYIMKSQFCFMSGDRKQSKALLYKAIEAAPDTRSAAMAKGILSRMFNENYKPKKTAE
jgi:uncharacterized protein YyaL (SSP411 family)